MDQTACDKVSKELASVRTQLENMIVALSCAENAHRFGQVALRDEQMAVLLQGAKALVKEL